MSQNPATSSLVSANGPSITVRFAPENFTRAPLELGCSPSAASSTPAFTSSSLYLPIAASRSWLGITPASLSALALTITMNRIVGISIRVRGSTLLPVRRMGNAEIDKQAQGARMGGGYPSARSRVRPLPTRDDDLPLPPIQRPRHPPQILLNVRVPQRENGLRLHDEDAVAAGERRNGKAAPALDPSRLAQQHATAHGIERRREAREQIESDSRTIGGALGGERHRQVAQREVAKMYGGRNGGRRAPGAHSAGGGEQAQRTAARERRVV